MNPATLPLIAALLFPGFSGSPDPYVGGDPGGAWGFPVLPTSLTAHPALSTRGLRADAAPWIPPDAPLPDLSGLTVPVRFNAAAQEYLAFFQGRGRPIYARWYARMGRLEGIIAPILAEHGVPAELIYLCMIESGFNPDAVSPAAAVGPWQFIESTGRQYGLRQDAWVDARRDPVASTHAAARHLNDLFARFGSWPLAMAAYNAGVGSIESGMRRANTNDFWQLAAAGTIPNQATRYVPKIMAAILVSRSLGRYGFDEVVKEAGWRTGIVAVPGGLDLRLLARKADVSVQTLAELNPQLRRGFTPPDGQDYPLRVPLEAVAAVEASLDALASRAPGVFIEHRVRFGERLSDIARQNGVSAREIRRINELTGPEPPVGQILLVPRGDRAPGGPEPVELLITRDPELRFSARDKREVFFPVRQPVSLREIATFFGVTVGHLALWNALDPEAPVQRGMAVRLFLPFDFDLDSAVLVPSERVTTVPADGDAAALALGHAQRARAPVRYRSHTVRAGETLWRIASRYESTVNAIRAHNGLSASDGLSPGQTLRIPTAATPPPRGAAARVRAKSGGRGRRTYTVKPGDSLGRIAKRHGTTVDAIMKRNGIRDARRLKPGDTLRLP